VACGEEVKRGEFLCFLHHTPGDLVIGESKVAGSAQRKLRRALLQHGSILLCRSEHAPQLRGIHDLAGGDLFTPESLARLLTQQLALDSRIATELLEWTDEEASRVQELRRARYADGSWNEKR
jgi:lipoate-protein ligase A